MKRATRIVSAVVAVSALAVGLGACGTLKNIGSSLTSSCTWDLNALAAQVVVAPVNGSNLPAATAAVSAGAGGVLLFGNMPSDLRAQLATLVSHAPNGHAPFVMADEEGGAIQRLGGVVDKLNSARWMADHWQADQIQQAANSVGTQMKALGVSMDLAPVLDLDDRTTDPNDMNPDGNRSFGLDASRTSRDGLAFAKGLQTAHVVPVVKHFPGLGGALNTDNYPAQTASWDQLQKAGLKPFEDAVAAGVPAVMTANATVPGLTDQPASLSPEVTRILRDQLHFTGLIMTDSLSAVAVSTKHYTPETAAVAALNAGADMVLYGSLDTPASEYAKMTSAVVNAINKGQLSRDKLVQAANAVLSAKHLASCN